MPRKLKTAPQLIAADLRKEKMTQNRAAIKLGVDKAVFSRLKTGRARITVLRALQLEETFGRPAEQYLIAQVYMDIEQARQQRERKWMITIRRKTR